MANMGKSLVREAAEAFKQGRYAEAQNIYQQLANKLGEQHFRANLLLCQRWMSSQFSAKQSDMPFKDLRVAAVMDEFTFYSYDPECQLLQLHPEHYLSQLEEFQPQILFIESAWQGLDQLWKLKISANGPEINACIQWCRARGIPTLFWNKEDPVHFATFLPVAKQVDHVFTTDIDCIPKYKFHVGHNRVHLLPFAAQPKTHNPIELYDRKDAFNFAGSYYLRYPERQRDFAALIDTVKIFRPVDIYDRNADNPHPHYTFPDHYKPMILGKLPFAEIDRAYKGYRYGINMNTIKQSQTMFARRVYELLASNTVVVSNFSRGMRLMFGDLVVSSDNAGQLKERVESIVRDDITYRKYRLLGLRKVMTEHTYAHRLAYICAKIAGTTYTQSWPSVVMVAVAQNDNEAARIIAAFERQNYANKQLFIVGASGEGSSTQIIRFPNAAACVTALQTLPAESLIGVLHDKDHYGVHYLTDLVLASSYSNASAFGKHTRFQAQGDNLHLNAADHQYRAIKDLPARRALARRGAIDSAWFIQCLVAPDKASFDMPEMLAIDEFNYIENGATLPEEIKVRVADLNLTDQGCSFAHLAKIAETLPRAAHGGTADNSKLPQLSASDLHALISGKDNVQLTLTKGILQIKSSLQPGAHVYLYARTIKTREELNLVLNSQIELDCESQLNLKTVFEFQDKNGKKISHQINAAGDKCSLAIPPNCEKVKFGLRVEGPGHASIKKIVFGGNAERPAAIICRSPYLVLSKQYPAYDDLYKYGFLHSRIRAYKKAGLMVDIYRIRSEPAGYREFEGIDIATGDEELLDATLATGQIKHVLVHLMDENMWRVLKKYIDQIRVTVWVHGAEIQVWQRREFEFERLNAQEIIRQKRLSDKRMAFWRGLLKTMPPNLHLVFVSRYFAEEVMEDLGFRLPEDRFSIVHNPIDTRLFTYQAKPPAQRKKILSIRPYASRKYANDLSVKAIMALKDRPWFSDAEFRLIGDGTLFEETVAPLRSLPNVHLERRFLTQQEIASLHKAYGIFLCPTRMDAQGVSRDEAMASGLVPVTNAVAAIPEFVDETCGVLAPAEDHLAMAQGIETLVLDPDRFQQMSAAAAARVRRQSDASVVIDAELKILGAEDASHNCCMGM